MFEYNIFQAVDKIYVRRLFRNLWKKNLFQAWVCFGKYNQSLWKQQHIQKLQLQCKIKIQRWLEFD